MRKQNGQYMSTGRKIMRLVGWALAIAILVIAWEVSPKVQGWDNSKASQSNCLVYGLNGDCK